MLFVDAGLDNVGIGTGSPTAPLEINASTVGTFGYTGFKLKYGTSSVQSLTMGQVTAGNGGWFGTAQYRSAGNWRTEGTAAGVMSFSAGGAITFSVNDGLTTNTDYLLTNRFHINPDDAVFNEPGSDYDFRVESNDNSNAIFMNAGNGTTAFGSNTDNYNSSTSEGIYLNPGNSSSFSANSPVLRLNRMGTGGNDRSTLEFYNNGTIRSFFGAFGTADGMYMGTGNGASKNLNLYTTSNVFNEDSADQDFRVESAAYSNMLSVDAGANNVQVANARLKFEIDADPIVDTVRETVVNGKTYRGSYGQGYNTLWAKSLYTTVSTTNRTFPILSVDRHGGNNRVWVKVTMRAAGAVANHGNEAVGYALINADGADASRTHTTSVTVYGTTNSWACTFSLGWNTSADPDVLEVTTTKNANYVALSFDIEVVQQDGNAPVKFLFSTYG